ncbi:hypothetical protein [Denitrobaculum tricleocarpae]|uniref:DUF2214 domain-containing protein n=1 Tax=Denitrobaculum tricleocarpae TaxID=2591009 RepID=A0A545TQV7_9PROT|nr:hypothetical protein [Denitrobaculum tricleocarpae]TQV79605.1 hypothetical protein FKG95_12820 [Denitrobaculum tricleocarpae]
MEVWATALEALTALQNMALPAALRTSRWVYPIVNAGHILGLAMLFGAILPLDLRLLGVWSSVPIKTLSRVLLPVAIGGLTLSLITGLLLFSVSAAKYAATPLFLAKLLLVGVGVVNALLLRQSAEWQEAKVSEGPLIRTRLQLAGGLSILLWLAIILCGRFLAYI